MRFFMQIVLCFSFLCAFASLRETSSLFAAEPWSTYRGNTQRTANTDNKAGPEAPKILWVHKSQEHFVASIVPDGDKLFLSGLGAFNVSNFHELSADPKALSQPSVSESLLGIDARITKEYGNRTGCSRHSAVLGRM